jgi:hypothetical protein
MHTLGGVCGESHDPLIQSHGVARCLPCLTSTGQIANQSRRAKWCWTEIAPGVFRREWSQAKIEFDFYSLAAEITRKQKEAGRSNHFHAGPVPDTNRSVRFAQANSFAPLAEDPVAHDSDTSFTPLYDG